MRTFLMDGKRVSLTPKEIDVFSLLFNARGGFVTKQTLIAEVYSHANWPDDLIRQCILRLREKLQPTDFRIANQHGRGYWLSRLPEVVKVAA